MISKDFVRGHVGRLLILALKRICGNCIKGKTISINDDIYCRENGPVSYDYTCSKHRYSPTPGAGRSLSYKCIDCEFFAIADDDPTSNTSIGLCRLFSVRTFDGRQKNICSKFVKKCREEVS